MSHFVDNLKQLRAISKSLRTVNGLINKAFTQEIMDKAVFDFYGALQLELSESELHLWPDVANGFESISPKQIINTPIKVWQQMILFAAETEAPINNYSIASAEVLRAFLPSLSSYMGRTIEEEALFMSQKSSSQEFCDTVWCREESRHGPTLVEVATKISGRAVGENMTYEAEKAGDFSSNTDVYDHIIARNGSEWHANGLYLYLQAHSTGATKEWLANVCRDETRHLTVFAAAYTYLYGPQYSKRIKDMLKSSLKFRSAHKKQNSHGDSIVMALNASTVIELLIIHYLIERKIRKYLKTIPLITLQKLFEIENPRRKRPQGNITKEKRNHVEKIEQEEFTSRKELRRWPKRLSAKAKSQMNDKLEQSERIKSILKDEFSYFKNFSEASKFTEKLKSLNLSMQLELHITEFYRDYTIMSRGIKNSSKELELEFDTLGTGFLVNNLKNKSAQEYACFCRGVTREQIFEQLRNGVKTIEEVRKNTQATTGCGRCLVTIEALLASS